MWHTRRGGRRERRIRASGPANYADGIGAMQSGPPPRRISNRVFNDLGQNLFSENKVSQWVWVWGQFIDHDIGLRDETPAEDAAIPFDSNDPLEQFANDLGQMAFNRTPAAPGTGTSTSNPRQQINTNSSVIDASQVYGDTAARLAWLKAPNGYDLLLPDGDLPHASDKPGAPVMDLMGPLMGNPGDAIVAGDVRANENTGLTSIQTLFAREHNRIADALPKTLSPDDSLRDRAPRRRRGDPAHHLHGVPACVGVSLPPYSGYKPSVDPSVANEFATVGFRAHSMVHGEFEPTFERDKFSAAQSRRFAAHGMKVEPNDDGSDTIVIPLGIAFGNPDLVEQVGLGPAPGEPRRESIPQRRADRQLAALRALPDPQAGRRPIRAPATSPRRIRPASAMSVTSARSMSSARATTACRATTSCARSTGSRP